jgi:hypothetical protein
MDPESSQKQGHYSGFPHCRKVSVFTVWCELCTRKRGKSVKAEAELAPRDAADPRPTKRPLRVCHCGRQDRGVTPVGLGPVLVGGSSGGVFAVGSGQWAGAEDGAG